MVALEGCRRHLGEQGKRCSGRLSGVQKYGEKELGQCRMTKGIPDGQCLLGVAINSKNTGVRGDSNATSGEIKFRLVCVCSFFRADFTAMTLRQYDADEFDFHIEGTKFNCLSNGYTPKHLR